MCGLFGAHKNHNMSTTIELKQLNENIIGRSTTFLQQTVDVANLKDSRSYSEYLQIKSKSKVKACRSAAQKVYEVL